MAEELDDLPVLKKKSDGGYDAIYTSGDELPVLKKKGGTEPTVPNLQEQSKQEQKPSSTSGTRPNLPPITLGEESLQQGTAKSDAIATPLRDEATMQSKVAEATRLSKQESTKKTEQDLSNTLKYKQYQEKELSIKDKIASYLKKLVGDSGTTATDGAPTVTEVTDEPIDINAPFKLEIDQLLPENISENADPELRKNLILKNSKEYKQKTADQELIYPFIKDIKTKAEAQQILGKAQADAFTIYNDLQATNDKVKQQYEQARRLNEGALAEHGFTESFSDGIEQTKEANRVADALYTGNEQQFSDLLEQNYMQNYLYGDRKKNIVGEMLGGQAMPIGTTLVASILSGGNPIIAGATGIGYYSRLGAGSEAIQVFNEAMAQGKTKAEATALAKEAAGVGFVGGGLEGALGVSFAAGDMAKKALKISSPVLKSILAASADAGVDAGAAMGIQYYKNAEAIAQGIKRGETEGLLEEGAAEAIFGLGFQILSKGAAKIKTQTPKIYNSLVAQYGKVPPNVINATIDTALKNGEIAPTDAEQLKTDLTKSFGAQQKLDGVDIPQDKEADVVNLQVQIDELEAKKKTASPAVLPAIEAKIAELTTRIQVEAGIPLSPEERAELNRLQTAKDSNTEYDKEKLSVLENRQKSSLKAIKEADEVAQRLELAELKKLQESKKEIELSVDPIIKQENLEENLGKTVSVNNKKGVLVKEGENRYVVDGDGFVYEINDESVVVDKTPKPKEKKKATLVDNKVDIDGTSYDLVSVNKDKNDKVVSLTLKKDNGQSITIRDEDLALDIAIAQKEQSLGVKPTKETVIQEPTVEANKPTTTPEKATESATAKVETAVIEIDGKIYEGKNHAEAILKAQADGKDISKVDRQAEGKFKLSDGTIIDRAEAKKRFGKDRSELIIEQDANADQANKDYAEYQKGLKQGGVQTPTTTQEVVEQTAVEPIRQLGTGANVYFETDKHRVNDDFKSGKVLLNVGSKESEIPMRNIEFDNASEAVAVAKELDKIYPNGVPDAVLIDKVVEDIRNKLKSTEQVVEAPQVVAPAEKKKTGKQLREERLAFDREVVSAEPSTIREWIMQYFAGGGKINTDDFKSETGFGIKDKEGRTRGLTDFRKRIWMHNKFEDTPTMARLIENLQEDWKTNFGEEIDEQDARNEIISIMNDFDRPYDLIEALRNEYEINGKIVKDRNDRIGAKEEAAYWARREEYERSIGNIPENKLGEFNDEISELERMSIEEMDAEADRWWNSLSNEEKEQLTNPQENEKQTERTDNGLEKKDDASNKTARDSEKIQQLKSDAEQAKRKFLDAENEYVKITSALDKDVADKQGAMFDNKGKEQKLFDDSADLAKQAKDAKRKLDEAKEAYYKAQGLVDDKLKGQVELEIKSAKQDLSNALDDLRDATDITKLGAIVDPEKQAEAMYKVHKALVKLAKAYIAKGVNDVKKFASQIGIQAKHAKQAWDEANGGKVLAKGEIEYDMADIAKMAIRKSVSVREKLLGLIDEQKTKTKNVTKSLQAIHDFIKDYSDRGNLTRADYQKIIDILPSIKNQETLDKAADKILDIINNAKSDKIEVSERTLLKDRIKAEVKAANEGYRQARFEQKQYAQAIHDFLDDADVKRGLTATQAKVLAKRAASVSTDKQFDKFVEYAEKVFDNASYAEEMAEIKSQQDAVKKRKHTSLQRAVNDFASVNPELIPDSFMPEYQKALDELSARVPNYATFQDIYYQVMGLVKPKDQFSNVKTYDEAKDLYDSIALNKVKSIEEYRQLFKDISAFKRRILQLIENETDPTTIQGFEDMLEQVGKDQSAVETKYASEINSIKTDLINELKQRYNSASLQNMNDEGKALLKEYEKLDNNDLRNLSPEELYNLQSIFDNIIDIGYVDIFRLNALIGKAKAETNAKNLASQVSLAKPFALKNLSVQEMTDKLAETYSAFWENVMGLNSRVAGAYQNRVVAPMERAIGKYRDSVQDGYKKFYELKKKYNLEKEDMDAIGMVATYLREYGLGQQDGKKGLKDGKGNKFGERDWFKEMIASQSKTLTITKKELDAIKKIWDKLPKDSNGQVDIEVVYKSYTNNETTYLSQKQLDFLKEISEWKEDNITGKQRAANEFRGKPFEDILFHIKRIRKDKDGKNIASSPIEISQTGNVKIAAGSGKEVVSDELGAIEHNFEKIFSNNLEETMRDYHLTPMLQEVSATLKSAESQLDEDKAGYIKVMRQNLSDAINNEFTYEEIGKINKFFTITLPKARAAQVLIAPLRTIGELFSSLVSYPLRSKQLGSYLELFRKKDTVQNLLNATDSPYKDKANIHKHFDIQDGELKGQSKTDTIIGFFAALPERMGLQPIWMASFDTSFEKITGRPFDREAYNSNPSYAKANNKAIMDAAAQADQAYSEIAGGTSKASQRRKIKYLPVVKGANANSAEGRILAFMTGYPFRETQTISKAVSAIREAYNDPSASKGETAKEALPILGSIFGAISYGLYQTISYEMQRIAFGDEEDKEEAKANIDALFTPVGIMKEASASIVSLGSAAYSGLGRQMIKFMGNIALNMAETKEDKLAIRSMVRSVTFQDPLEIKFTKNGKLNKFGLKGQIALQTTDAVVPMSILIDNAYKGVEAVGGIKYLTDKVESGEALSEPEKEALVLAYVAANLGNLVAMFLGAGFPTTMLNRSAKQIIEDKKGRSTLITVIN